jgi:hypothetical protein
MYRWERTLTKPTRTLTGALGIALLICLGGATGAFAQDGSYLCSAGSRDGQLCISDDDCPGGACVLVQGVCDGGDDDGFFCLCPNGTCSTAPVCSLDPDFGTCAGGVFAGDCCLTDFNCSGGRPCVPTQRVCLGGEFQALPCLRNDHCPGSTCGSTGRFCLGICQSGLFQGDVCAVEEDCDGAECVSDFQDNSCVQDIDCCFEAPCPAGICTSAVQAPATATPTRTPTLPGPSHTPTPDDLTPAPTVTALPTVDATATIPPVPTPTGRPLPGESVVAEPSSAGSTRLTVVDATSFPDRGVIDIYVDPNDPREVVSVGYSRTSVSNTLFLDAPLPRDVQSGVTVRSSRSPAVRYETTGEGAGCAIGSGPAADGFFLWLGGLLVVGFGRRLRWTR